MSERQPKTEMAIYNTENQNQMRIHCYSGRCQNRKRVIAFPVTMSHASMTPEARAAAGITEKTIRLSIGIEHPDDLIADLQQALGR